MASHFDVIIIGAGIAGLIAARRLLANGILNVVIVEGRDRVGGRIHCITNDDDPIDLGAHFVHGTVGNAVYQFASPLGLMMPPDPLPKRNIYIFARNGQQLDGIVGTKFELTFDKLFAEVKSDKTFTDGKKTVADMFDILKSQLVLDPHLVDVPPDLKQDLFDQFAKLECLDLATSEPQKVSAAGAASWQECEKPSYSVMKEGYSSLLPLIVSEIPERLIKLSTVVTKIVWSDAGCLVECQPAGRPEPAVTLSATRVICTIPLGCLKAETISFVPPLPDNKLLAIKSIGVGLVDRYHLQFERRWWPEDCNNLFIVWPSDVDDGERNLKRCLDASLYETPADMLWYRHIFAFDVEPVFKSGYYLVAYASGYWASVIESLPDSEILLVLCSLISTFLTSHFENVELPVKMIRSKWLLDPFARGSYTVMPTGSTPALLDIMAEPLPSKVNPRLMFAGEATHPRYFSAVHGAWETGEREADRIIATIEASTLPIDGNTSEQLAC